MNEQSKNETRNNHSADGSADKRGRLISAAVIATIILSFIAVSVFGIFQLTTRMMVVCPRDLPVNDPAPILWQDIVSDQVKGARLGVPEKVTDVYLKGIKLADGQSQ
jgi:hypothetical protein